MLFHQLAVFSCSRPSEDRTIPLSIIAERTKLSIEDVEHLLMKSLSVSSFEFLNNKWSKFCHFYYLIIPCSKWQSK